jgi:hypothetical protein
LEITPTAKESFYLLPPDTFLLDHTILVFTLWMWNNHTQLPIHSLFLSVGESHPVCECNITLTTDLTLSAIPNTGHSQPFPVLDMARGGVFLATYT